VNTLSESIDGVIGVDTHRDTLAAAVTAVGATLASTEATANADGYQRLLRFARRHLPNQRCWAVEGTSSYGAGLTEFLIRQGGRVLEVCRPNHENMHNWVTAAKRAEQCGSGCRGEDDQVSADESDQLRRLRKKVAELELDKEILRKAAQSLAT
jgi:transposase-like protein